MSGHVDGDVLGSGDSEQPCAVRYVPPPGPAALAPASSRWERRRPAQMSPE